MIKFKAKLGHWSSVVGMPILLLDEKGGVIGQLGLSGFSYPSESGWVSAEQFKKAHIELCQQIVDQLNGASQS
jgi:hypothetical protein